MNLPKKISAGCMMFLGMDALHLVVLLIVLGFFAFMFVSRRKETFQPLRPATRDASALNPRTTLAANLPY